MFQKLQLKPVLRPHSIAFFNHLQPLSPLIAVQKKVNELFHTKPSAASCTSTYNEVWLSTNELSTSYKVMHRHATINFALMGLGSALTPVLLIGIWNFLGNMAHTIPTYDMITGIAAFVAGHAAMATTLGLGCGITMFSSRKANQIQNRINSTLLITPSLVIDADVSTEKKQQIAKIIAGSNPEITWGFGRVRIASFTNTNHTLFASARIHAMTEIVIPCDILQDNIKAELSDIHSVWRTKNIVVAQRIAKRLLQTLTNDQTPKEVINRLIKQDLLEKGEMSFLNEWVSGQKKISVEINKDNIVLHNNHNTPSYSFFTSKYNRPIHVTHLQVHSASTPTIDHETPSLGRK